MSDSVRPHRWQPTRLPHPWDSPGKNTGVGCHFLLQCMKVKSESEGAQSCPTLSDPMDCSLPDSIDYPVILIFLTVFLDSLIILFSYILILKRLSWIWPLMKVIQGPQYLYLPHGLCALLLVTVIGLSFIHRFGKNVPKAVHITMSYAYFLFLSLMNPIIYSIKTKQIQQGISCLLSKHKFGS